MNDAVISYQQELTSEHRVCPMPLPWNTLWEMLPGRKQIGANWQPAVPLILAGWTYSTDAEKRARFFEHLEWAEQHGVFLEVINYLQTLAPDDWYTA